jgi:hypothetical protein
MKALLETAHIHLMWQLQYEVRPSDQGDNGGLAHDKEWSHTPEDRF